MNALALAAVPALRTADMTDLDALVGSLPPVTLDRLDAAAALRTRVDRKYVLDVDTVHRVLASQDDLLALAIDGRRSFEYRSLYFDTDDLAAYRSAAHRRRRRFKVRIRHYVDSGDVMLEVKTKSARGETIKVRRALDSNRCDGVLDAEEQAFVDATCEMPGLAARLQPTIWTGYRRSTLVDLADGSRVTLDSGLRSAPVDGDWRVLTEAVILESKSARSAGGVDAALWSQGHRPVPFSKFIAAMAVDDPSLPANKWNRVLRDHLGWRPERCTR